MARHPGYALDGKPLGTGGYAEVYRARRKDTGEYVALKRLWKSVNAEGRERMRREVDVLRQLRHKHIIQLLEAEGARGWYTMPLAEGSLESLHKKLSEAERLQALQHAAEGLAFAHSYGYVHRDVTPRNILALPEADGTRRWVVADWGLVRRPRGQTSGPLTQGAVGTEGFMAPETWEDGHEANAQADVYGLGRVAAWLATGKWPRPNLELLPEGPWRAFVQNTTARAVSERPQSMVQVLELLQALSPDTVPEADLLAWHLDSQGQPRTFWLRAREGGASRVMGSRPGLFIGAGERLWEWRETERPILLPELAPDAQWPELRYHGWSEGRLRDAHLVDVMGGGSRLVSSPRPYRYAPDENFERTFHLLGGLGGLLFFATEEMAFGTYHRGGIYWSFLALDVTTGASVEVFTPEELAWLREQEQLQAFRQLQQEYPGDYDDADEDFDDAEEVSVDPMWLTTIQPRYAGPGGASLTLLLQFTAATYHAGHDHHWSSDTRSVFVVLERIPRLLEPFRTLPQALIRHWGGEVPAPARGHGWSTVGKNPAVLELLEELFGDRDANEG